MGLKHHAAPQFFGVLKGSGEGACDGAPSAGRLRLEHGWVQARFAECTWPRFGARFRRSCHALVETVPGRPGTSKQVVREGSTLRFRLERLEYLNIANICSRKHEWGLNTMPHPNFFGF